MTKPTHDDARRIRVTGRESMADVVLAVFADVRLLPLVADRNPTLPPAGALPAGVIVVCPARTEAQAFAARMGFVLGFDEKAGNGTDRKRAWAHLQQGHAPAPCPVDPLVAAQKLLDAGLGAQDAARRLSALCAGEDVDAFVAARVDPRLQPVQRAAEFLRVWPRAASRLTTSMAILEATQRPCGLLRLLEATLVAADNVDAALSFTLVPEPERRALATAAPRALKLVQRARDLAGIERGARDLALATDVDGGALRALVEAVQDGVEPLAGDRLALVGLEKTWPSCVAHFERLRGLLKTQHALLGRAGLDVVRRIARDDPGHCLARPWPLVVAVTRGLGPLSDVAGPLGIDDGIGGLILPRASTPASRGEAGEAAPVVRLAALQARAAHGARVADEGAALAARVGPRLLALLAVVRPVLADHGAVAVRRARRRSHYEAAMIARSAPGGAGIVGLVDDVLAEADRRDVAGVRSLTPARRAVVRNVAGSLTGTVAFQQRGASELARALVVVAMALEPDLGALLGRTTGAEQFRALVARHASRILGHAAGEFAGAAA
ncbi:MAG: hypothetical protein FJ137_20420 [Deltaproteobacteria bacterium]|nr:hypothetical protein [Deltaproteobacteria bacterium]